MTRILLIGQAGQVGQELQKTLAPIAEVIGVSRETLDLTQTAAIRQRVADVSPDLIVNAAAYTAVDRAETELDLATAINADAPKAMAEAAQQLGAPLIHISTDYVFDGTKNTPYLETDATNPVSAYGRSKLAGEMGIQTIAAEDADWQYAIVRTAWVYGSQGKANFVKTMLRLGAERDEVRVVADQIGTPTWATDIARAIATLSERFLAARQLAAPIHHPTEDTDSTTHLSGIYHLTNTGVTSWYDFAVEIFEEARVLGFPVKLQRVVPITTADYPTPAQRPAYSVLSGQKIAAVLASPVPHWRQALKSMLSELYTQTSSPNL